MHKPYLKSAFLIIFIAFTSGCASKGLSVRSYVDDRERVDLEATGNAGYLMGTPQYQEPTKKTRRIYVLEVNKEPNTDVSVDQSSDAATTAPATSSQPAAVPVEQRTLRQSPRIDLPSFDDVETSAPVRSSSAASSFTEYTVEKDDTLQKISKKFYNSYSKWPKIYEANKEKIANPDKLQPGITIRIPQN